MVRFSSTCTLSWGYIVLYNSIQCTDSILLLSYYSYSYVCIEDGVQYQVQVLIWKKFHHRLPLPKHQTGGRCNTTVLTKVLFYRNGCWSTQKRVPLTDSRSVLNMSVSLWISSTSAFFSLDVWFIRGFLLAHSLLLALSREFEFASREFSRNLLTGIGGKRESKNLGFPQLLRAFTIDSDDDMLRKHPYFLSVTRSTTGWVPSFWHLCPFTE